MNLILTLNEQNKYNDTKHEVHSQSPIAGKAIANHGRLKTSTRPNGLGRRVKTQLELIQTDSIECYKSLTQKQPLHIHIQNNWKTETDPELKSKLIHNSLRSTFCARYQDPSRHTRPSRSTSLGRWTVRKEWNLRSRQSTSSPVEPQSSP